MSPCMSSPGGPLERTPEVGVGGSGWGAVAPRLEGLTLKECHPHDGVRTPVPHQQVPPPAALGTSQLLMGTQRGPLVPLVTSSRDQGPFLLLRDCRSWAGVSPPPLFLLASAPQT